MSNLVKKLGGFQMDLILDVLPKLGLPSLLVVFILILKAGIDAFNITGIENKLSSNSDKFVWYLSYSLIGSLVFTFLLFILQIFSKNNELNTLNDIISFIITYMVIFTTLFFFMYILILLMIYFFQIKIKYTLKDLSGEWEIERRVDKNTVLLSKSDSVKFIKMESLKNKLISTDLDKDYVDAIRSVPLKHKYFNTKVNIWIKISTPIVISVIFFGAITQFKIPNLEFITKMFLLLLYILIVLFIFHSIVACSNKRVLNKWDERDDQENNANNT